MFIWICLNYSLIIFSHVFETVEFLNLECLLVSFKHSWWWSDWLMLEAGTMGLCSSCLCCNYLLNCISQGLVASTPAFPFDIKRKPCSSLMCLYPLLFPLIAISHCFTLNLQLSLSPSTVVLDLTWVIVFIKTLPVSSSSAPVLPTCYCPNDPCSSISLLTLQYLMGFLFSEESSSCSLSVLGV